MVKCINYLIQKREMVAVSPNNKYLFANEATGPINGCRAFREVVDLCPGIANPKAIRSTKLRKYLGTTSQGRPAQEVVVDTSVCYRPAVSTCPGLCVVIFVGCAVLTMFYGFRFGKTKSALWLQSFYFSFMICVFISQPFLILFFTIVMAIRYRNDPSIFDYHHGDIFGGKSKGRDHNKECSCCEECKELERGVATRQRSRYLKFARPPQEKQLIEARKKIMKEKKAYAVLQDYWQFVVFFVVLTTIACGKDLSSPYYVNESLKNSLVREMLTVERVFLLDLRGLTIDDSSGPSVLLSDIRLSVNCFFGISCVNSDNSISVSSESNVLLSDNSLCSGVSVLC